MLEMMLVLQMILILGGRLSWMRAMRRPRDDEYDNMLRL